MYTILVVEDDLAVQQLVRDVLEEHDYRVVGSGSGCEALALAQAEAPDLVLLDIGLPDMDGLEVGRRLRGSGRTSLVPIVFLTSKAETADKLSGFAVGADDYITKPFDPEEMLARIGAHLRRLEQALRSELTGLPGNTLIERAIRQAIESAGPQWAVLYADIDQFKVYNDAYGFMAGNDLIRMLARVLREVVHDLGQTPGLDFVGHIGGDDFVVITGFDGAEEVCREVIRRFDAEVPDFYRLEDRERGYLLGADRQGEPQRFPVVSLSIAVVTGQRRSISSPVEVATIAAEVKRKAKAVSGSADHGDQRLGRPAAPAQGPDTSEIPPVASSSSSPSVDTQEGVRYNQLTPIPPTAE